MGASAPPFGLSALASSAPPQPSFATFDILSGHVFITLNQAGQVTGPVPIVYTDPLGDDYQFDFFGQVSSTQFEFENSGLLGPGAAANTVAYDGLGAWASDPGGVPVAAFSGLSWPAV